jgi:hypothetical protein
MNECCSVSEKVAGSNRCRECNMPGRPVSFQTMESLLTPEAFARIQNDTYYFDATPHCEVVYFSNGSDSYFHKSDLRVRVGIKETEAPIPICYCFGHTVESARQEILLTGRSTIAQRIRAEIQAGTCACEVRNPSGNCCLGEVNRVIKKLAQELQIDDQIFQPRVERI